MVVFAVCLDHYVYFFLSIIAAPGEYKWSSYGCKAQGKKDLVVDFDESYLALGENKSERQEAYEQYVRDTIPEEEIKLIRDSLQRGQLTGSDRFRQ